MFRRVVGAGFSGTADGGWKPQMECGHYLPAESEEEAKGRRGEIEICHQCEETDDESDR